MVDIIFKVKITQGKIKEWVNKSKDLHALHSIRAKINKRLTTISQPKEIRPFKHILISKKREILKELFI